MESFYNPVEQQQQPIFSKYPYAMSIQITNGLVEPNCNQMIFIMMADKEIEEFNNLNFTLNFPQGRNLLETENKLLKFGENLIQQTSIPKKSKSAPNSNSSSPANTSPVQSVIFDSEYPEDAKIEIKISKSTTFPVVNFLKIEDVQELEWLQFNLFDYFLGTSEKTEESLKNEFFDAFQFLPVTSLSNLFSINSGSLYCSEQPRIEEEFGTGKLNWENFKCKILGFPISLWNKTWENSKPNKQKLPQPQGNMNRAKIFQFLHPFSEIQKKAELEFEQKMKLQFEQMQQVLQPQQQSASGANNSNNSNLPSIAAGFGSMFLSLFPGNSANSAAKNEKQVFQQQVFSSLENGRKIWRINFENMMILMQGKEFDFFFPTFTQGSGFCNKNNKFATKLLSNSKRVKEIAAAIIEFVFLKQLKLVFSWIRIQKQYFNHSFDLDFIFKLFGNGRIEGSHIKDVGKSIFDVIMSHTLLHIDPLLDAESLKTRISSFKKKWNIAKIPIFSEIHTLFVENFTNQKQKKKKYIEFKAGCSASCSSIAKDEEEILLDAERNIFFSIFGQLSTEINFNLHTLYTKFEEMFAAFLEQEYEQQKQAISTSTGPSPQAYGGAFENFQERRVLAKRCAIPSQITTRFAPIAPLENFPPYHVIPRIKEVENCLKMSFSTKSRVLKALLMPSFFENEDSKQISAQLANLGKNKTANLNIDEKLALKHEVFRFLAVWNDQQSLSNEVLSNMGKLIFKFLVIRFVSQRKSSNFEGEMKFLTNKKTIRQIFPNLDSKMKNLLFSGHAEESEDLIFREKVVMSLICAIFLENGLFLFQNNEIDVHPCRFIIERLSSILDERDKQKEKANLRILNKESEEQEVFAQFDRIESGNLIKKE